MMYTRGQPDDYNDWDMPGWSYPEILPYFKRSEQSWRGASSNHSDTGPMRVDRMTPDPVFYPPLIETARRLGYDELDDFTGAQLEGFGIPDFTMHKGQRISTAVAFLHPVLQRGNLQVITGAHVARVLLHDKRATGVEYLQGEQRLTAKASREVIISGGAFNSPQILLLSGIGPADDLREMGIELQHNLSGVGRNLQDHPMILAAYRAALPKTYESCLRLDRLLWSILRWKLSGAGPLGKQPLSIQGFIRSSPTVKRPDMQFQVVHVSYMARPWFPGLIKGAGHEISCGNLLLRPDSRGCVSLQSTDPRERPKVILNLLNTESDLQRTKILFRFMRHFFATRPAADLVNGELLPGPKVQTEDEIEAYIRTAVMTGMHSSCSCAMGTGTDAVVDARLKVQGVEGLRVVDTSVMPCIVSGNTNAPAIMIAEKATDMILGKTPPPPAVL
jgi:choline dehydrogenase